MFSDKEDIFIKKKVRFQVNGEDSADEQLENEVENPVKYTESSNGTKTSEGCKPKQTVGHHRRGSQLTEYQAACEIPSSSVTQPGKAKLGQRLCRTDRPCYNLPAGTFASKHIVQSRFDINRRKIITNSNTKKKLVRNVEQSKNGNNTKKVLKTNSYSAKVECEPSTLETPEMYSILNIAKEIQALKADDAEVHIASSALLPSATRQALEEKVTTKLNFAVDDQLYTDLVDLSFDDNLLTFETYHKNIPVHKKDKEPCLSDFYTPVGGKQYNCLSQPVLNSVFKIQNKYNGFSVYRRSLLWNDINNI